MRVRFWGTRGSVASAGPHTVRYGGNTACVSVTAGDGTRLVLDCGTGARGYGLSVLGSVEDSAPSVHLLITHTHWDHIQGFPFFAPAYVPGAAVMVYASAGLEKTLESSLAGQMEHTYFPVNLREMRARLNFQEVGEGHFRAGGVTVQAQYLNHTALTLGYRLEAGGKSVVYATDHEPFLWNGVKGADLAARVVHPGDARHLEFLRGADLLIHDAQYTDQEYAAKRGWGHSTYEYVVDLACLGGVKRLALFHHDPTRSDRALAAIVQSARARARRNGSDLEVSAAAEGLEMDLLEAAAPVPDVGDSLLPSVSMRACSVLIGGDDASELTRLSDALSGDGYQTRIVMGCDAIIEQVAERQPDLLMIAFGTGGCGETSLGELLARLAGAAACPTIALVSESGALDLAHFEPQSVDIVVRPWAPSMIRTRVRVWLARHGCRAISETNGDLAGYARFLSTAPASLPDLFRGLPTEELALLLGPAGAVEFKPGDVLFREGDATGGVYYIREGAVRLSLRTVKGEELTLGFALPGDTVGELAALDGGPRTATAVAAEVTRADYLAREQFLNSVAASPHAGLRLLTIFAARLRRTDRALGEMSFGDLYGRIARRLLYLSQTGQTALVLTVSDLAGLVGAEPGQAAKVLKALEHQGLVRVDAEQHVVVESPEELLTFLLA